MDQAPGYRSLVLLIVRVLVLMTGNGLLLAFHSDLWADGSDFSGSNVPSEGPWTTLSPQNEPIGRRKGPFRTNSPDFRLYL